MFSDHGGRRNSNDITNRLRREKQMATESKAWERQKGETSRAFAAFACYRDMGSTRTLERVAAELRAAKPAATDGLPAGKKTGSIPGRLGAWSSEFNWVERAAAWDREADGVRCKAHLDEIRKMNERQAKAGLLLQSKGIARLNRMTDAQIDALTWSEVVSLLVKGINIERTARGEATEVVKQDTTATHVIKADHDDKYRDIPLNKLIVLQEAYADAMASAITADSEPVEVAV
jgi:hypothetical protein